MEYNKIIEGFINLAKKELGVLDKNIEAIAVKRYSICLACEDLDKTNKACKLPEVTNCCTHCGCYMKAKVLVSEAKCAIDKW